MRLSLRHKLVGGFGLLVVLIILLSWVTLSLFGSLRSVQRKVLDEALPGLVAVDEIVRSYTAQSSAVRGYLINTEPALLDQFKREAKEARARQRQAMGLFRSGKDRAVLERLVTIGASFQDVVVTKVVPLALKGRRALAQSSFASEGAPLVAEIEALGSQLRSAQDHIVADSEDELNSRSNQVIGTLLLVTIAALVIGVVVAVMFPRRLVNNLSRLVDAARAIGRGDLNQRVEIRSGDEVEELSARFGEMQAGLKRLQELALQDRELEIAASIQRNLLQRLVPETPGIRLAPLLRQANRVGGDWYDFDFGGGVLTVAVGDASGKGIGAALMATVALSVLRAERSLGAAVTRIVQRANEALREATDPDSFTTLIYATVDSQTGEARWLNMGHPSPFLLRAGMGEGDLIQGHYVGGASNRTLGWFDQPGLQETVVKLNAGDRLILYTDGFLEGKSPDGEFFGEERFAEAMIRLASLDAASFTKELVADVERFTAGKLEDDLTMVVVEFQGAPLPEGAPERLTGEEPWHSRR